MGETELGDKVKSFVEIQSCNHQSVSIMEGAVTKAGKVAGTYIHGLFDNNLFAHHYLNQLRKGKGLEPLADDAFNYACYKSAQYDLLAEGLRDAVYIKQLR